MSERPTSEVFESRFEDLNELSELHLLRRVVHDELLLHFDSLDPLVFLDGSELKLLPPEHADLGIVLSDVAIVLDKRLNRANSRIFFPSPIAAGPTRTSQPIWVCHKPLLILRQLLRAFDRTLLRGEAG